MNRVVEAYQLRSGKKVWRCYIHQAGLGERVAAVLCLKSQQM